MAAKNPNQIEQMLSRIPEEALQRFGEATSTPEGYYRVHSPWQLSGQPMIKIARNFSGDEISERFKILTDTAIDARNQLNSEIHEATQDLEPTAIRFHINDLSGKRETDDGKRIIYRNGGIQNFLQKFDAFGLAKTYQEAVQDGYDEMLFWTAEYEDLTHLLGYLSVLNDPMPAQSFMKTFTENISHPGIYIGEAIPARNSARMRFQQQIRNALKKYGTDSHNRALRKELLQRDTGVLKAGVIAVQATLGIGRMHHREVAMAQICKIGQQQDVPTQIALRALHRIQVDTEQSLQLNNEEDTTT